MHYLKYKESEIVLDVPQGPEFRGEVRYEVRCKHSGKLKYRSPWNTNIITNVGLAALGEANVNFYRPFIGSGNTTPQPTDIQLVSQIAGDSSDNSGVFGTWVYYVYNTYPGLKTESISVARFDSSFVGVIREYGVRPFHTTDLAYRALVTPEYTKTDQEIVDVYHRITVEYDNLHATYASVSPVTIKDLQYNYLIKPYRLQYGIYATDRLYTYGQAHTYSGLSGGVTLEDYLPDYFDANASNDNGTYQGANTSSYSRDTVVQTGDAAYIDNNFEWHLDYGNHNSGLPSGIRLIHFYPVHTYVNRPACCIGFEDTVNGYGIQKDRYHILNMTVRTHWSRI